MTPFPLANEAAARVLGRSLRNAGYSEDAIYRLLGDDAYSTTRDEAPVESRRLQDTPLATLVRALFLQLPVTTTEVARALGPRGVDALEATGLAKVGERVEPRTRVLPIGKVLLASDGFSNDADDPADYVATYTPTARVLDSLTPRPQVGSALDVGTGSGVHALLAAQHARRVVATDVNPRALAYTQLNAALNGLANVECRQGSLFEPVEGETFDLITCNAPYVVSPERRWAYRDSGFQADELSERVVQEAARHLADDGFAAVQVSWLATDEQAKDERVLAWVAATRCDAWILPTLNADALAHAAEWNSHLAPDPEAFGAALDAWLRYFDELGVRSVSEGVVILRRRAGEPVPPRVDPVDEDELEDAEAQIRRAFAARAALARLGKRAALLDARLALVAPVQLEVELEPENGEVMVVSGRVAIGEGTRHVVETTDDALDVVAELDGRLSLGEVVDSIADRLGLSDAETTRLRREAVSVSQELLELGALILRA